MKIHISFTYIHLLLTLAFFLLCLLLYIFTHECVYIYVCIFSCMHTKHVHIQLVCAICSLCYINSL
jgi:hypothetical protein